MEAFFCELDTSAAQTDNSDLCKHAHEETFFKTLTGMDASSGHTLATGGELMKFYANSLKRSFFSPPITSSGWWRETESVTTPTLLSTSSYSCQCHLIAEVIR